MKANYIFILLLVTTSLPCMAQTQGSHYISISVGASAPTGKFSKADAGSFDHWDNNAGFAKTGIAAGAEGAYYFIAKFALAGTVYYSLHSAFSSKDVAALGASYTDAFAVDYSTVTTHESYSTLNILLGPQYSINAGRFAIDVRALAGIVKSFASPSITVELEDQSDATFTQKSSTAAAFGWQVGAGFRYPLSNKVSFIFRADYFNSTGIKTENENRTNNAGRLVTKQPLAWVNTTAGLAFAFGKK